MSKKTTKALASATLMSLVLTTALTAGPVKAAAGSVTRTGGADRYETAAKVATTNWTSAENVILVNGLSYADSVSASVLAKKLNAPILLTEADSLNSNAKSALEKLSPKNVYIVGGTGAVSQSVESSLSSYKVTRLAGTNRYDTNLAVANKLVDLGVSKDNMLAVTGQAYSDALSAAPVAAAKDQILLLTTNDKTSMKATDEFAKDANVTVIGTTNSVDADTYSNLAADKRIDGGKDRFATNINILKAFDSDLKATSLYAATGKANADGIKDTAFADALVASAIAGKNSAPLVLLDSDSSDATSNALNYIGTKATKSTDLQVVGGTGVVSDSLVSKINDKVNPKSDDNAEVSSIEATSLNQIKVVFSSPVDEDTAKDVTSYEVGGTTLNNAGTKNNPTGTVDDQSAVAKLQDDDKTVLITLAKPRKQSDELDVKVKKGILSKDKSQTVPELTQTVSFSDTTAPTVESVSAQGNKKITVKFSEPVNFGSTDIEKAVSKFKIDGQNVTSFGLDTDTTKGLSKISDYIQDGNGKVWSNKVELYFNSSLKTGNHTLKISDGDSSSLEDCANFPVQETSTNFDIDTLTSTPKINSITAEDSGKIYINFDRPMDAKTAKTVSYYGINGDDNHPASSDDIELKKDDTQIKISNVSGFMKKNSNTIYISDDVKDAYGNKVADDTRESFTLDEDDTKPDVTSVKTLDNKTIRVTFNKDVNVAYATNTSNYKIKDNGGSDITNDTQKGIDSIKATGNKTGSASVFDITMRSKLTDSQYTITIKNVRDMATTPNTMEDKIITFDGADDVAPSVTGAYAVSSGENSGRKVVVYFDKEMDSSSIEDLSSYKFKNGNGDVKALPSDTDISVSSNNKSATIEFPSSYNVKVYPTDGNLDGKDSSVYEIDVIGAKDLNGKSLDVSSTQKIQESTEAPSATVDKSSFSVGYDVDDLKATIKFDSAVDSLNYKDFRLGGIQPTSGYKDGEKIVLIFGDDSKVDSDTDTVPNGFTGTKKIDAVKFSGKDAVLTTVEHPTTTLISGETIEAIDAAKNITPYDYNAQPKTVADNWNASVDEDGNGYVDIAFDTKLDTNSGIKTDDFVFSSGEKGTNLKATGVKIVNNNTVRFTFDKSKVDPSYFTEVEKEDGSVDVQKTPTITVYAKSNVSIRTPQDDDDNYAYYKPSDDDISVRTITVGVLGAK
jgi:putative cell wall-binding protein